MKRLPLTLLVIGLLICVGAPLLGLAGVMFGMESAFQSLGDSGISDPKALAAHVGSALTSSMVGLILSATVGLPLVITALAIQFGKRAPRASGARP